MRGGGKVLTCMCSTVVEVLLGFATLLGGGTGIRNGNSRARDENEAGSRADKLRSGVHCMTPPQVSTKQGERYGVRGVLYRYVSLLLAKSINVARRLRKNSAMISATKSIYLAYFSESHIPFRLFRFRCLSCSVCVHSTVLPSRL